MANIAEKHSLCNSAMQIWMYSLVYFAMIVFVVVGFFCINIE